MADPERVRRALDELREAGFRLAIDDFGTGYSSLSRLHEVGADLLKIDRSFVSRLPRDDGLADAMIQIARSLRMDVVAEGIETLEQRGYLADRSVVLGQGYLFGKPVPAEDLGNGSLSFAATADSPHR